MNEPLPEPLEDFLTAPPTPRHSPELRAALLDATTRVVRRRRAVRRVAMVGSLAAAVLMALAAWALWPPGEPERVVVFDGNSGAMKVELRPPEVEVPPAKEKEPPAPPAVAEAPALPPALAKEWQAFDAPKERKAALLLEAGDRYVDEHQDFASALRCYRHALAVGGDAALEITPNDNWLVMALKNDRRKEH